MNIREFTDDEKNTIIKMYKDGETVDNIRKVLKCKGNNLREYIKSLNLQKRKKNELKDKDVMKHSKHLLDRQFFSNIDNDIKAYWLGFLYADGCVNKKYDKNGNEKGGSLEVTLKKEDEYHLYSFLYDLKSDCKISERTITLNDKKYYASRLCISSIDIVNDLIKQGCVPAKSLILEKPCIQKDLISHFIRGYFDGDGCVGFYIDGYKSFLYEILGTKEILEFIQKESNVNSNIRKLQNKNIYSLRITGKNNIETFHSYIYEDKTVFLQRKYEKSLEMIKYLKLAKTERSETAALADLLD